MYLYERATRRLNKDAYRKKIAAFWMWLEKFLRKIRLIVMKLDGKIVTALERLRQKNVKTIEDWKRVAESAEKNIQKGQGFLSSKGAFKKRKKKAEYPEDSEKAQTEMLVGTNSAAAMLADVHNPLLEEKSSGEMHSTSLEEAPGEKEEMKTENNASDKEEYAGNEESVAFVQQEDRQEYGLQETQSEDVPLERKKEIEEVVGKINELADEMERDKVFEGSVETIEGEEVAEDAEAGMDSGDDGIRTKKEQECIEILMQNPADIKAYWKLGIIYSKRRNYEDALACFRQIVKIDPTYTKAKQKVIEIMEKMKKRGK